MISSFRALSSAFIRYRAPSEFRDAWWDWLSRVTEARLPIDNWFWPSNPGSSESIKGIDAVIWHLERSQSTISLDNARPWKYAGQISVATYLARQRYHFILDFIKARLYSLSYARSRGLVVIVIVCKRMDDEHLVTNPRSILGPLHLLSGTNPRS